MSVTTLYQAQTRDPNWMTETYYLLTSLQEDLRFLVYDHHTHRRRGLIGSASLHVSRFTEGEMIDVVLQILKGKKRKGDMLCSVVYYPVVSSEEENPNEAAGIVHLIIHHAEGLQATEGPSRRLEAIAKLRLEWDAPSIHITPRRKAHMNKLVVWESGHEFLCLDKARCVIYVDIVDPGLNDPLLGYLNLCLNDLVDATSAGRRSWPLSGSETGILVASAKWKPLDMVHNS
ncbi:hypothetical protein C8J57DRAFT_18714 [Mycena rebaudengoi]|nr:hypothetical protein C8J57DRAFT_18714 [Mycena rebaudengoi]